MYFVYLGTSWCFGTFVVYVVSNNVLLKLVIFVATEFAGSNGLRGSKNLS